MCVRKGEREGGRERDSVSNVSIIVQVSYLPLLVIG